MTNEWNQLLALKLHYIKRCSQRRPITRKVARAIMIMIILERDNFRCVACGLGSELTIDHISKNEYHNKKSNWKRYEPRICKTLCVKCHIEKNMITEEAKIKAGISEGIKKLDWICISCGKIGKVTIVELREGIACGYCSTINTFNGDIAQYITGAGVKNKIEDEVG